jgi:methanogenic corrinoid protein MtbC1
LLDAVIKTDRIGASRIIDQALASGVTPGEVLTEILDPALLQLGQMWERRAAALAQVFVASKVAEDILQRCVRRQSSLPVVPPKGAVVIGNIQDDFHSLGRRIVKSFLEVAGWQVHDLGSDVAAEQFVDWALEVDAAVIGVSAMMQTTALNIRKVRDLIDARGLADRLRLAVGGAVFNWRPELVDEVGGDGTAASATDVDALLVRLQSEVKRGEST